jgi:hypothetical protein
MLKWDFGVLHSWARLGHLLEFGDWNIRGVKNPYMDVISINLRFLVFECIFHTFEWWFLSWLNAFVHIQMLWRSFELKRVWFKIVECNYAYLRIFKSFKLEWIKFDVFKCKQVHLNVSRLFDWKNYEFISWLQSGTF